MWKLKKCAYGLSDASRYCYERLSNELQALGGVKSAYDPGIFIWADKQGMICIHVDELWAFGTKEFQKSVVEQLQSIFVVGTAANLPHNYSGVFVDKGERGCYIYQTTFCENILEIEEENSRTVDKSLETSKSEKSALRSTLEKLLWPAVQSRPDLLYSISNAIGVIRSSTVEDILRVNKIVRRLKQSAAQKLYYPSIGNEGDWFLAFSMLLYATTRTGQHRADT